MKAVPERFLLQTLLAAALLRPAALAAEAAQSLLPYAAAQRTPTPAASPAPGRTASRPAQKIAPPRPAVQALLPRSGDCGAFLQAGLAEVRGLLGQRRLSAAEAAASRLAQLCPRRAEAWHLLGLARAARGRYGPGAEAQGRALELDAGHPLARGALALALRERGQGAAAESAVREGLRRAPGDPGLWNLFGNLRADLGDLAGAEEAYAKALRLAPGYAAAWSNLAEAKARGGRSSEALQAWGRALALDPSLTAALRGRAEARLAAGDAAGARADFEACARIPGHEAEGRWGLLRLALASGRGADVKTARRLYREALQRRDQLRAAEAARGLELPEPSLPGPGPSRTPLP